MKFIPPPPMTVLAFEPVNITVSSPVPPKTVSVLVTDTRFVKLASFSVSLPVPRSTLPFITAVPSVMVSAPAPPISGLDIGDGAGVGAGCARVSLSAPAARSTDIEVVSAVPRVTVSAPVPPVMVSDVGDGGGVGEVAEGERVGAAAEVDGGVDGGGAEGDDVGAGAAGEGLDVLTVPVLPAAPRVSLSLPAPRSTAWRWRVRCRG